ncbi:hypothetical protein HDU83_008061 [Entophlyctis luteolus]|nr:hypothetical protein HDU83_008061 [Entophlyctis luteolus]
MSKRKADADDTPAPTSAPVSVSTGGPLHTRQSASAPPAPCRVVLAAEVAESFMYVRVYSASCASRSAIKVSLKEKSKSPLLVSFLANDDPAAAKYAEWTGKTCVDAGFRFELRRCSKQELEDKLDEANKDPGVNGIMIYYPIFGGTQDAYLQNSVSVKKDVEGQKKGLCHTYRYNMYRNIRFLDESARFKCIIPCTPLAVVKILEHIGIYRSILPEGNRLYGHTITVVNRSEVVGRPLAALLANDGAKVYSADEFGLVEFHRGTGIRLKQHQVFETDTKLEDALRASDVVITGVPSDKFKIDTALLKDGVVAINFSTAKNFRDDVKQKASIFVPSVGKVTVAMLLRNLVRLEEYQDAHIV